MDGKLLLSSIYTEGDRDPKICTHFFYKSCGHWRAELGFKYEQLWINVYLAHDIMTAIFWVSAS